MYKFERDPILAIMSTLLGSMSIIGFFLIGMYIIYPAILGLILGLIDWRLSKKGGFKENEKKALNGVIMNFSVIAILVTLQILL